MNLLLAFALAVQDTGPEDALKKIENALQSAKTARVAFTCEGEMKLGAQSTTFKATGTLLLKKDNKVNFAMKLVRGGQDFELGLISDGQRVWQRIGAAPPMQGEAPKTLKSSLVAAMVRIGIETAVMSSIDGGPEMLDAFKVSDLSAGPEEKNAKSLKFKVTMPNVVGKIDCVLTYDPKTFKILKRDLVLKTQAVENTVTEAYAEYSLNGDIADDTFTVPEATPQKEAPLAEDKADDVADIPAQDLRAGGDPQKRYFQIGPRKDATPPAEGYKLLVVLPGGDGSAEFHPFLKRLFKNALSEKYLVAELVAVEWAPGQFNRVVWPTQKLKAEKMRFTTEDFVEAVIADVGTRNKLDRRHVYSLSWSSGGPAAYAASMNPKSSVTGSFIAMSVFQQDWLPSLEASKGRAYYLYQSPDDKICPLSHAQTAADLLRQNGATVELATYEGGHGWTGPVYENIRKGIDWLEKNR
jgi:predicted esterase